MSNHKLSQEACKLEHSVQKKWHVQSYEGERDHDPSSKVLEVQNSWRTENARDEERLGLELPDQTFSGFFYVR